MTKQYEPNCIISHVGLHDSGDVLFTERGAKYRGTSLSSLHGSTSTLQRKLSE